MTTTDDSSSEIEQAQVSEVAPWTAAQTESGLARLGLTRQGLDFEFLSALQWAWLQAQPFHNIELLAGAFDRSAPVTVAAVSERILAGLGGPCHVHALGFLGLLRGLGFRAHLAAATIAHAGDHLVVLVRLGDNELVCDVGNGQPYVTPFPLDRAFSQHRFGWSFTSEPYPGGIRLVRHFADGSDKCVYTVDPTARALSWFQDTISQHHAEPGFGPFLSGVRAVRITEHVMLTLRDDLYQRHSAAGVSSRRVRDADSCRRLLAGPFGLAELPIERALDNLHQLGAAPWARSARPRIHAGADSAPSALVSVAVTGRTGGLRRLGTSLVDDLTRSRFGGWPGRASCTLVIVENSPSQAHREQNRATVESLRQAGLEVEYEDCGVCARGIAAARGAQTEAIARCCAHRRMPSFVWMVDDDVVLAERVRRGGSTEVKTDRSYLATWHEIGQMYPELAVAIGPLTGDPPIRLDAMLRTQLFDMSANLDRFAAMSPDDVYVCPVDEAAYQRPDYYYDHSEQGAAHLTAPFSWLAVPDAGPTVREQLCALFARALDLSSGCAVTRPLLEDSAHLMTPRHATLRGGSAVFFDFDACLFHTYPSVDVAGISTRRSDMIGVTRLDRAGIWPVRTLGPAGLHHRLHNDESAGWFTAGRLARARVSAGIAADFFGVMFARLAMAPRERTCDWTPATVHGTVQRLARERAVRIRTNLAVAGDCADAVIERLGGRSDWWARDAQLAASAARVREMLVEIRAQALGGETPEARAAWRDQLERTWTNPDHLAVVAQAYLDLEPTERAARRAIEALVAASAGGNGESEQ